jgi:hypothetical protein
MTPATRQRSSVRHVNDHVCDDVHLEQHGVSSDDGSIATATHRPSKPPVHSWLRENPLRTWRHTLYASGAVAALILESRQLSSVTR